MSAGGPPRPFHSWRDATGHDHAGYALTTSGEAAIDSLDLFQVLLF